MPVLLRALNFPLAVHCVRWPQKLDAVGPPFSITGELERSSTIRIEVKIDLAEISATELRNAMEMTENGRSSCCVE
jgi:hypothetical protein